MPRLTRTLPTIAVLALLALTPGCGGDKESGAPKSSRSGARSLSEAMTRASQLIDDISANRASLDRFGQDVGNPISQTGDVIALLTGDEDVERKLLTAARQQRTFLEATEEAARSRSRGAAVRAAQRARSSGRRAAQSYSQVVAASDDLAGLVPAATAFNTSNLRRAVAVVFAPKPVKKRSNSGGSNGGGRSVSGGGTDCGGGVTAMNSATSCPFARNVADVFRSAGGDSVIDVYSPVTKRVYTMRCDLTPPVVCTGGNNASVRIR